MARVANPDWTRQATPVGFADGYPILLLSENSVTELNHRLQNPVTVMRFRPNIILRGAAAFAEDNWREIRSGDLVLDVLKPCARCSVITIDPETGLRDPEPITALAKFRKSPAGVLFGQNCASRGAGSIAVGDPVEILRSGTAEELHPDFRIN